jgi:hypothetical protein
MSAIHATWKNGQIILDETVDWPEGLRLLIEPERPQNGASAGRDDGAMSPEEIARTLAAMDQIRPLEITDEERAAREAERQARKQWEKDHFMKHADKLRRMWE